MVAFPNAVVDDGQIILQRQHIHLGNVQLVLASDKHPIFVQTGGAVTTGEREIRVRVADQRRVAETFRDVVVVSNATGALIPLRSLAEVRNTFDDDWNRFTFNGKPAVNLIINTNSNEDIIRLAQAVRRYVKALRAKSPPNVHIQPYFDASVLVSDRLDMVLENLALGVVLVFGTLWLFLNLRLALWVGAGLPISIRHRRRRRDCDCRKRLRPSRQWDDRCRGRNGGHEKSCRGRHFVHDHPVAVFLPLMVISGQYGRILPSFYAFHVGGTF